MDSTEKDHNMTITVFDRLRNSDENVVLTISLLIGFLTVGINSIQVWFLRTKFRREVNTLFVIIQHLCIADLLNGVRVTGSALLSLLHLQFDYDEHAYQIIHFIGLASGVYIFAVSTLTLDSLTILKMLKIVRNKSYQRSAVKRICYLAWVIAFILSAASIAIYATRNAAVVNIWRNWMPILTYLSIVLQCYCVVRICRTTLTQVARVPRRADGASRSTGMLLQISLLQVLAFVLCETPLSTLMMFFGTTELVTPLFGIFVNLTNFHSIVDPVLFFFVYRRKLRRQRVNVAVEYNGQLAAAVIHRLRLNPEP